MYITSTVLHLMIWGRNSENISPPASEIQLFPFKNLFTHYLLNGQLLYPCKTAEAAQEWSQEVLDTWNGSIRMHATEAFYAEG